MQKLTPRERLIYAAMEKKADRIWSVEDLAQLVWDKGNLARPASWRNSIIACMQSLRTKTYLLRDNRVVRASKDRGRGNVARYTLAKTAARKKMEAH